MFEQSSCFPKEANRINKHPLIVLGMHRSGTSMLAQWLTKCGFDMGKEMIGPGNGNSDGHFEDRQFYQLHKTILKANNQTYKVSKPISLNYSQDVASQAAALYDDRKDLDCWGWKDPRTCLTMDLWHKIIPSYNCIIVYRDYHQVVDSLFRRKHKAIQNFKNPIEQGIQKIKYQLFEQQAANHFLNVWIEYNRRILENRRRLNASNYIVIKESSLVDIDCMIFKYLNRQWNYRNTTFIPIDSIYKPHLMKRTTKEYAFAPRLIEKAEAIRSELAKLEHKTHLRMIRL
ncbi:sulfotransferase [Mangrovibacterium lignilyticum]|uniref:sulfotransferase n=1 Tax=Mangrovibacterium lignilyticum TaxID=2668052 RepID=UPI0013D6EA46|nr:sulfotransferase [Mangrovibacterium lignilyticum]